MAKWIIRQYQRGLLYQRGRFVKRLEPGKYRAWPWQNWQIGRRLKIAGLIWYPGADLPHGGPVSNPRNRAG